MPTVSDILKRKSAAVTTIGPDATVHQAARLMSDQHIGALVVVRGSQVAGIITERDMMGRIVACKRDPSITKVLEVMTTPVACCGPDTTLAECRTTMTERRIRRLPVVTGGELKGIVTIGDLMAWQADDDKRTIEQLHEYLFFVPQSQPPKGASL